ncbi:hypothetical protein [Marinoscillum sp.]|uniref:hypothetical protein n=1 Tax=Marinoscillum sp. TaxID=2024838 RepID=UPI003BA893C7
MRLIIVFVAIVLCFSACRDKVICPAFQSTYILDDSVRSVYYSYLWKLEEEERLTYLAKSKSQPEVSETDSAALGGPVIASASEVDYFAYVAQYKVPERDLRKSKFGVVKYEPYWLKNYRQRTAPMENVLKPEPPPLMEDTSAIDMGEFVASDFNDSLAMDSMGIVAELEVSVDSTSLAEEDSFDIPSFPPIAQMAPEKVKPETRYLYRYDPKDELLNVEQQYYNKYFGQQLYVKVVENPVPVDTTQQEEKGSFFKNLFSKKKAQPDSLKTKEPPIVEEEPPVEEDPDTEEDGF